MLIEFVLDVLQMLDCAFQRHQGKDWTDPFSFCPTFHNVNVVKYAGFHLQCAARGAFAVHKAWLLDSSNRFTAYSLLFEEEIVDYSSLS